MTTVAKKITARIKRLEDMKLKGFCTTQKATVKKYPIEWEKPFDSYLSDRILIFKTKN